MCLEAGINQLLNDIDSSTSFLNEIISIDPKYSKAYELLMDIEVSNNNLEQAIKYGNSALKPNRIFSKCSATEQLLVRIDDKLNRIMKGAGLLATDEDVVNDLIGYLVLLKISMDSDKKNDILDISTSIYGTGIRSETNILDHARDFD